MSRVNGRQRTRLGNPDNVRWTVGLHIRFNLRHRFYKYVGHLETLNTAGCQREHFCSGGDNRREFQHAIFDFLVLGQDNPAVASRLREPLLVFCIGAKTIIVYLDLKPSVT